MIFTEYLEGKKIDPDLFKEQEPMLYRQWEEIFSQLLPDSFTQQKLYLINPLRRRFPYQPIAKKAEPVKKVGMKPKIPRIKPT